MAENPLWVDPFVGSGRPVWRILFQVLNGEVDTGYELKATSATTGTNDDPSDEIMEAIGEAIAGIGYLGVRVLRIPAAEYVPVYVQP